MALNKSGKTEFMTVLVWVVVIGVIAYAVNFGGFQNTVNGMMGKNQQVAPQQQQQQQNSGSVLPVDTANCPTNGKTTYTVNIQDALTTTATSLYPEYYIFNGNQLIKEGTLSSSASTVDVACGKDYKMLLINTTADSGMYPLIVDLKARLAEETVNKKMYNFGGANIVNMINPSDKGRIANLTLPASTTKKFQIQFAANETQQAYNEPMLLCQYNVTSITALTLNSFDDGTPVVAVTEIPNRITPTAGYKYKGWIYGKMMDMTQPLITADMSITAGSVTPSTTDTVSCKLADQTLWKTNQYKTATSIESAFTFGAENTETSADVGAVDSSANTISFNNGNGV